MANEQRRRGFCPRVWTPMESGDGLLVRVHAATRWLDAAQVERLSQLASEHGNGLIEITRRANLQLRGVRAGALPTLRRELVALGLAAESAWAERRFALHASPWLGLDPACAALTPVLEQLEQLLVDPARDVPIHPKLAIALAGPYGECDALQADLVVALDPGRPGMARLAVAQSPVERLSLGLCALEDVAGWVAGWLERLGEAPVGGDDAWQGQRMHAWIERHGVAALEHVRPRSPEPLEAAARAAPSHNAAHDWLGWHAADPAWLGVMLPFGAGDAVQWRALSGLSRRFGDGSVRAHPGRGLLLRGVAEAHAPLLTTALLQQGLCVAPEDPLTRVVACAGAPACSSALGETRQLARELAQLAGARLVKGATLHVSGCAKSCARSGASAIVVVHGRAGLHLAFERDATAAANGPARTLDQLRAALSAAAGECATPAPYPAVEPDVP